MRFCIVYTMYFVPYQANWLYTRRGRTERHSATVRSASHADIFLVTSRRCLGYEGSRIQIPSSSAGCQTTQPWITDARPLYRTLTGDLTVKGGCAAAA